MAPARPHFDLQRLARVAGARVAEPLAGRTVVAKVEQDERRPLDVVDRAALDPLPAAGAVVVVADTSILTAGGRALWRILRERRPDCLLLAPGSGGRGDWIVGRARCDGRRPRLAWRRDPSRVARRWARAGGAVLLLPGAMGLAPLPAELVRLCRLGAGPLFPARVRLSRTRRAQIALGRAIPALRLERLAEAGDLLPYVELRLHALRERDRRSLPDPRRLAGVLSPRRDRPIAPPVESGSLAAELAEQDPTDRLLTQGDLEVWALRQGRAPRFVHEVGRLREATFRAVGEGTGRALDLDAFDASYLHLVVWNRATREVVGGYRAIGTDEVLDGPGLEGLYTHTLFRYDQRVLRDLGPALELGRSFVRVEYQRSYAPLLLLWRGVATWIARHPRYRFLFGAVSITAEYQPLSQALMIEYLASHSMHPELSTAVHSRRPVARRTRRRGARWSASLEGLVSQGGRDVRELSEVISEIERDHKGVPTLLKEYLKLGGQILDFNVDPDFSDVLDALLVVDLLEAEPRALRRYFEPSTLELLRTTHGCPASPVRRSG